MLKPLRSTQKLNYNFLNEVEWASLRKDSFEVVAPHWDKQFTVTIAQMKAYDLWK